MQERERRTKRPETVEEAKRLSASFADFAEAAWPLIQPGVTLIKGIVFDAICHHLQAVAEGRVEKLLVNVPPGNAKSSLVTVLFPCWLWTRRPETQIMCASHGGNLALRDSVRRRDYIIASDWYQARWGKSVCLLEAQQTKSEFLNTAGGFMFSTSVGGDVLGRRCEISVLDDPHKVDEAESEIERENTAQWLNLEWATRRNRGASVTGEICIMQRLHESDTSGIYLKQGGWTHLMLPMYFEPERKCSTSIGWTDPRTAKDEVLDSALNTEPARKDLEVRLGPYGRAGQFQQRPAPLEGGIIKRAWIRHYDVLDDGRLRVMDGEAEYDMWAHLRFCTVDVAVREEDLGGLKRGVKSDPAYTVFAAWSVFFARRGPCLALVDLMRARMEGPDIVPRLVGFHARWKFAVIGVESVGFQLAVVQEAKRKRLPVREIATADREDVLYFIDRDKTARAVAATPLMADGRFWVPQYAPWLEEYIRELTTFPNSAHADQVDVTAYAVAIAAKLTNKSFVDLNRVRAPSYTSERRNAEDRPRRTPRGMMGNAPRGMEGIH